MSEHLPGDTAAQLSEAQTAVAVATRGRDLALLNRVAALLTPLQIRVHDLEDALADFARQLDALAAEVARRNPPPP